jgi:hypothetical protein
VFKQTDGPVVLAISQSVLAQFLGKQHSEIQVAQDFSDPIS